MSQELTYRNNPDHYRAEVGLSGDVIAAVLALTLTCFVAAIPLWSGRPLMARLTATVVLLGFGSFLAYLSLSKPTVRMRLAEYWRRNVTGYELVLMLQREGEEAVAVTDIQHRMARQFRHTPSQFLLTIPLGGWFTKPRVRYRDMCVRRAFVLSRVQWRGAVVCSVTLSDCVGDTLTLSWEEALEVLGILGTRERLAGLVLSYRTLLDGKAAVSRTFEIETGKLRDRVMAFGRTILALRRHRRDLADLYLNSAALAGHALDFIKGSSRLRTSGEGRQLHGILSSGALEVQTVEERLFPDGKDVIRGFRDHPNMPD